MVSSANDQGSELPSSTAGDISPARAIMWLKEAAAYFESRPVNGEDRAYWANVYNASNARKISALIERGLWISERSGFQCRPTDPDPSPAVKPESGQVSEIADETK